MQNEAAAKLVTDFKVLVNDAEGLVKASANRAGGRIVELGQRLKNRLEEGKEALTIRDKNWTETAQGTKTQLKSYLREHAWTALLVATGIGAVFGLFLRRRGGPTSTSSGGKKEESL